MLRRVVTNFAVVRSVSVTIEGVRVALLQVEDYLLQAPVLEAVFARREAGLGQSDDEEAMAELASELTSHQSPDGSWGQHPAGTAEALLLLGALLPDVIAHESGERGAEWLRGRQNRPGAFSESCERDLHEAGLCGHAVSGFFSPGAPQVDLAGSTLSNGLRFASDRDARVGISSLALRARLRWTAPGNDDRLHLAALRRIADQSFRPGRPGVVGAAPSLEALATLAVAPRTPEVMSSLHAGVSRLVNTQRADGSFGELSIFLVMELLLSVIRAGYLSPAFDAAIMRGVEMLIFMQKQNGSWGRDASPHSTLIGWRTLRHARHSLGGD